MDRPSLAVSFGSVRARVASAFKSPARLFTDADRRDAEDEIHEAGRLTNAYGFLLFSACGIAVLGLLQSSVAVVIGAMLISPLMGPIMSMGMALARLDPRMFKTAALTLALGAFLSVLAATLIVWASPLKDVTPEILARTRPTLLDLGVALLSGFVGAYLSINRKGGAIAGVAIATALMPPLAVVGFGLATGAWQIAGGAMLLFLTNVVAILTAVFGVARRYGFKPVARKEAAWEVPALLAVTAVLCIPLAISLRAIVLEARETTEVRGAISQAFEGASPHITELKVQADEDGATLVQCVVVTRKYMAGAEAEIARRLKPGSRVEIEQILTAKGIPSSDPGGGALVNRPPALSASPAPEQRLRAMLSPIGQVQAIERQGQALAVSFATNAPASLSDYQAIEQAAQRLMPQTPIALLPPLAALPEIPFTRGSTALSPQAAQTVDSIGWALGRWGVTSARVEGGASPSGRRAADLRIAEARAAAVADRLRTLGIKDVTLATEVPNAIEGDEAQYLIARVVMQPSAAPTPR